METNSVLRTRAFGSTGRWESNHKRASSGSDLKISPNQCTSLPSEQSPTTAAFQSSLKEFRTVPCGSASHSQWPLQRQEQNPCAATGGEECLRGVGLEGQASRRNPNAGDPASPKLHPRGSLGETDWSESTQDNPHPRLSLQELGNDRRPFGITKTDQFLRSRSRPHKLTVIGIPVLRVLPPISRSGCLANERLNSFLDSRMG